MNVRTRQLRNEKTQQSSANTMTTKSSQRLGKIFMDAMRSGSEIFRRSSSSSTQRHKRERERKLEAKGFAMISRTGDPTPSFKTQLPTFLPTYIPAYLPTYQPAYLPTHYDLSLSHEVHTCFTYLPNQGCCFFRVLWCSQSGDHSQKNLAKYGYILDLKVIIIIITLYSWLSTGIYHKKLEILNYYYLLLLLCVCVWGVGEGGIRQIWDIFFH